MKTIYVKHSIPYNLIKKILFDLKMNKIIFYIDLQSICKGLYNKNNIFTEINYYIENDKPSDILPNEYRDFLNNLYQTFKYFDPFFVTFYDDGKNIQNSAIDNSYKGGRKSLLNELINDDDELLLFRKIKQRYFEEIAKRFNVKNRGKVFYLKEFESDMIPYYCITNNLYNSKDSKTLNVILSNDKDLLQCCQFNNTVQITNIYYKPTSTLDIKCWDNKNAVGYLSKTFKPGNITAKHISLILALAGDKADNITGLKGIGYKKAISLIENFNIPFDPLEIKNKVKDMPIIIQENVNTVMNNMKMISFEEQIKRVNLEKYLDGNDHES